MTYQMEYSIGGFVPGIQPHFFTYEGINKKKKIMDWHKRYFAEFGPGEAAPSDCFTSLSFWLGIEGADSND